MKTLLVFTMVVALMMLLAVLTGCGRKGDPMPPKPAAPAAHGAAPMVGF